MLKEGALDKFQAIFGLHVEPEMPVGSIASRPGTLTGFVEAGQAGNVIPETVKFGGTIRSLTTEGLSYLQQRIKEVLENQAAVLQCTASVDFMEETMRPYPATVNDEAMYEHVKQVGEVLLGESNVQVMPAIMGSEDFSFYAQKMKAAFFIIGVRNKNEKSVKRLHTPYFFLDEEVLPIGAALHAAVAISYLDTTGVETH
ncbi:hypothetical protein GH714_037929 [Hevea brasiliensis]|uniref:Peptidase M20 dimerisation domain-containing protein n=1 Tax=Hevea brasiliensis TaxID=3981 RepID=A0A6A6KL77_HEVBR|nr:hypothetical protein GH714_037929 [Hevea brasiliensis]